ncbi:MAG: UDP-N-acetylmuramoyl-L-alanine--D-glutamate ligase [Sphingomonadaceae bacterium]
MKTPTEIARERFAGKKVTVVGLAREGVSLVRFLAGVGARVTANDRATAEQMSGTLASLEHLPVRFVLGEHPSEVFLDADSVFVSPGVPLQMAPLVEARRRGVPLSSETQLFFELCRGRLVGITGSSGKTTTTTLVGEMVRQAGMPVHVGGNIGLPLVERLDEIGLQDWVILEMSSFQLERLPYSPHVATVLNVTPNHLDRHGDMESYTEAKSNILRHQRPGDRAILSADDAVASSLPTVEKPIWFSIERPVEGSYLDGGWVVLEREGRVEPVCRVGDVRLRGRHNLSNVVAAVAVASALGVPAAAMRAAIAGFRGVPHRLEVVGVVDGVTYCNDSIATAPERSIASIRSFQEPVVLIAGGRDKHLPMEEWGELIRRRVKALVLMGEAADMIERAVLEASGPDLLPILRADSMERAVELAHGVARAGDVVLLAPGCTSFDMFKDFEERGERFRECVRNLGD